MIRQPPEQMTNDKLRSPRSMRLFRGPSVICHLFRRLPDHPKLLRELRLLERHTARSGKDSVDHPRGGHDDLANACAGAIVMAQQGSGYSSQQSFQDNMKMAAVYKKWARSVA